MDEASAEVIRISKLSPPRMSRLPCEEIWNLKKSGKKEKQVSFADQSPTPATPQESARKTIEKLLGSAFEEAFPNKAIIQYLGQKTIEGSDPFAAAVELASELQAVGNAVGKTLDDDRVARNING